MPRVILLLCLVGPALAEDFSDPATRAALVAKGTPALPELRRKAAKTTDKEVRAAIEGIIREIEKREPHGLAFSATVPGLRLFPELVNSKVFVFVVTVRNRGEKPVVVWPYVGLRVLDANGKVLKPKRRLGRHGRGRAKNALGKIAFVEIAPGKTWSFQDQILRYMHDPNLILGWQVPGKGRYTLEFTYHFDRAAQKKRCDPKWERLDDPKEPWNRAPAFEHTFTVEMRVE